MKSKICLLTFPSDLNISYHNMYRIRNKTKKTGKEFATPKLPQCVWGRFHWPKNLFHKCVQSNHIWKTTTNDDEFGILFETFITCMTSEQWPPVNDAHYFWVSWVVVVHRFDRINPHSTNKFKINFQPSFMNFVSTCFEVRPLKDNHHPLSFIRLNNLFWI